MCDKVDRLPPPLADCHSRGVLLCPRYAASDRQRVTGIVHCSGSFRIYRTVYTIQLCIYILGPARSYTQHRTTFVTSRSIPLRNMSAKDVSTIRTGLCGVNITDMVVLQ